MRSPLTVGLRKMRSATSVAMEHVLTIAEAGRARLLDYSKGS
jgi:hypothetical protein